MNKLSKFYRVNDLTSLLSMGKSTIYAWVKAGRFPKPIKVSPRMTLWSSEDIDQWLNKHQSN